MNAPQCTAAIEESLAGVSRLKLDGEGRNDNAGGNSVANSTSNGANDADEPAASVDSLSDDVLLNVFLYCGPVDAEDNLKLVSRNFQ